MALSQSELLARAIEIRDATLPAENTADRVGSLLVDLVKVGIKPYSPTSTYAAGDYALFSDNLFRALAPIAVGETPALVPDKWKAQIGRQDTLDNLSRSATVLATPEDPDNTDLTGIAVLLQAYKNGAPDGMRFGRFTFASAAMAMVKALTTQAITALKVKLGYKISELIVDAPSTTQLLPQLVYDAAQGKFYLRASTSTGTSPGTGTGTGECCEFQWTFDTLKAIADWDYVYNSIREGRKKDDGTPVTLADLPPFPGLVDLGTVNNVYVQIDELGITPLLNGTKDKEYQLRIIGRDGTIWTDNLFYGAEQFAFDAVNGSYRVLNHFKYLPVGLYTVQGQARGNVSASGIRSRDFEIKAADIVAKSDYRLFGTTSPKAGGQNIEYAFQQFYSDGTWKDYTGSINPIYLPVGAPNGVAFTGTGNRGYLYSDADAVSVATAFSLRAFIGINVDLPITLQPGESTTTPTVKKINEIFPNQRVGEVNFTLANVTEAIQINRIIEKPLGTYYGQTGYIDATRKDPAYLTTGTTVEVIWPTLELPGGTYYFREVARPKVLTAGKDETVQADVYSREIAGGGVTQTPVYGYVKFVLSTRSFEIRAAPADGPVYCTLTQYPAGYSNTARQAMTVFETAAIYEQKYYWAYTGFTGLIDGNYVLRLEFPTRTVYARIQTFGADQETILINFLNEDPGTSTGTGGGGTTTPSYTLLDLEEGTPAAEPRITRVTRGFKLLGGSSYILLYWIRGEMLGNGTPYWLEQRHLPATDNGANVWSAWQKSKIDASGYDALEASTTSDFQANLGTAGLATQVEFRIVDNNNVVYAGQPTLHYDYTLPASQQTNSILYTAPAINTNKIRIQGLRNVLTAAVSYVTVPLSTIYETKHQPTSGELATQRSDKPTGYTYAVIGPNTAPTDPNDQANETDSNFFTASS